MQISPFIIAASIVPVLALGRDIGSTGFLCVRRDIPAAQFAIPSPEDARTDSAFHAGQSMPFWQRHFVDAFQPPEGIAPETAAAIRAMRTNIAKVLATGRKELVPTSQYLAAMRLWKAGVREAAVAILNSGLIGGGRNGVIGEKEMGELLAAAKGEEPMTRFLLAREQAYAASFCSSRDIGGVSREAVAAAQVAYADAFADAVPAFREADPRIAETVDDLFPLPTNAPSLLGNEYLGLCRRADRAMDEAFAARGTGWARDVPEDGWDGWRKFNDDAESNLLAAVALRPDGPRALLTLASLRGRSCGPKDEVANLFNKAVSNSLDASTPYATHVLQFQTTRWGGSRQSLVDVASNAAATVRTDSTFAYTAAAAAVQKLMRYESESPTDEAAACHLLPASVADEIFTMFDKYIDAGEQPFMPPPDIFRCMGVSFAIQMLDWGRARRYAENLGKGYGYNTDAWWTTLTVHPADYSRQMGLFLGITNRDSRKSILQILDADAAGDFEMVTNTAGRIMRTRGFTPAARHVAEKYDARARLRLASEACGQ